MKLPTRNTKHGTRDQTSWVREQRSGSQGLGELKVRGSKFNVAKHRPTHHSPPTPALRIIAHLPPRMGRYIQTFCLDRLAFTLALRPAALRVCRVELMFTRRVFPQ